VRRIYLAGPPFAEEYRRRAAALVTAQGCEPVDPMRRDFRGRTEGNEAEIVEGDLEEIASCDAVLAAFTAPAAETSMEAWHARTIGIPVVTFALGPYWAAHYPRRAWYRDRAHWEAYRPVVRPVPGPRAVVVHPARPIPHRAAVVAVPPPAPRDPMAPAPERGQ